MLDYLYENIGYKIKTLAKWLFIIESIGCILTAIILPAASGDPDDFILTSLLLAICGPIAAFVGSWVLYAFGELVEDVHALRNKEGTTKETTKREAEAKREVEEKVDHRTEEEFVPSILVAPKTSEKFPEKRMQPSTTFSVTEKGTIVCARCGYEQPADRKICWRCGAKFEKK